MAVSDEPKRWKGIPYSDVSGSLDPHNVYESRAMSLARNAKPGLERFAYMVFGPSFIGSLAFALDPFSEIRFPTMKITPTNRTTVLGCVPRQSRTYQEYTRRVDCDRLPDTSTGDLQDFLPLTCVSSSSKGPVVNLTEQPFIKGVRSDTTVRTRPLDSKGGEFELFAPYVMAPPRSNSDLTDQKYYFLPNAGKYMQGWEDKILRGTTGLGPAFRVSQAEIDLMLTNERTHFGTYRSKYLLGMIRDAIPTNRKISIARNVGELKDLPLLLKRSVEYFRDPIQALSTFKGQGNQYLNYKFGWEATFRSVADMLKVPEQIAKEVNYLIERNGQSASFRSTRSGIEQLTSIPVVFYDFYPRETFIGGGNPARRSWKLRTVLNYTLKFPKIDIPRLREELLAQKWGEVPNPTDVYNLVPWTWLVDWFSGLGEYIDVLNTLMDDPNLFNYGYLTYRSDCKINYLLNTQLHDTTTVHYEPPYSFIDTSKNRIEKYCAEIGYKYQRRVDISGTNGVNAISRPSTLEGGQLAIIGALLTKFAAS